MNAGDNVKKWGGVNSLGGMAHTGLWPTPVVPNGGRQHNLDNIELRGNTLYRKDGTKVQLDLQTHVRLWPTPSASKITQSGEIVNADGTPWDGKSKPHSATTGKPIQTALADAVRLWPTPTVSGNHNRKGASPESGDGLATAVKNYATPQSRDFRTGETSRWEQAKKGFKSSNLNDQIGGKLSPDWTEWLMHWPVGWTSLQPLPLQSWFDWHNWQEWWAEEPDIPRVTTDKTNRVDRLKAIGNGQVSLCVAVAWHLLAEDLEIPNNHHQEQWTMNDLVKQSTELATDIGYTDEVSWTPSPDMDFNQYQAIGRTFQQIKSSLAWWVGDWLNFGEQKFGEAASQAMEDTGKAVETLAKWKAVSWRVPKEIRRASLTWTHHFYVAYVPDEHKDLLLGLAESLELSSRELKDVVKLDDDVRTDLLVAIGNYLEENNGEMTREVFFPLLNRFRLSDIEKEKVDNDDDEDEEDDADEQEDTSEEVAQDDLMDFWENAGVPLTSCGKYSVTWEGIAVRAAVDAKGKPHLVWEAYS